MGALHSNVAMRSLFTLCYAAAVLLLGSTEGWSLPACPSDQPDLTWSDCFGTLTFANGNIYVGKWKDGKYNQGTKTRLNGDQYIGEFKDNKRNGQGTYTTAKVDKYVGEYRNSKRDGQGTYTFAN